MSDRDFPVVARRRADGLHAVSTLTTALAAASVIGTGVVVYAVGHHATSAAGATTTATQPGTGSGLQSSSSAPTTSGAVPVAASHGS